MKSTNLSTAGRAKLLDALEKKRKQGMEALESFRRMSMDRALVLPRLHLRTWT